MTSPRQMQSTSLEIRQLHASEYKSTQKEPDSSSQDAGLAQIPSSWLQDDLQEDSYLTRPNRYFGPPSTWRSWTEYERRLAAAVDAEESSDLSRHLYNTYVLRKLAAERDSSRVQRTSTPTDDRQQFYLHNYQFSRNGELHAWRHLRPPVFWAAWPLPPEQVPRPSLRSHNDEFDDDDSQNDENAASDGDHDDNQDYAIMDAMANADDEDSTWHRNESHDLDARSITRTGRARNETVESESGVDNEDKIVHSGNHSVYEKQMYEGDLSIDMEMENSGFVLRECITATISRLAKERWRQRQAASDSDSSSDFETDRKSTHNDSHGRLVKSDPNPDGASTTTSSSSSENQFTSDESEHNGDQPDEMMTLPISPGIVMHSSQMPDALSSTSSDRTSTPSGPPILLADEDEIHKILHTPTAHILSQIDRLLAAMRILTDVRESSSHITSSASEVYLAEASKIGSGNHLIASPDKASGNSRGMKRTASSGQAANSQHISKRALSSKNDLDIDANSDPGRNSVPKKTAANPAIGRTKALSPTVMGTDHSMRSAQTTTVESKKITPLQNSSAEASILESGLPRDLPSGWAIVLAAASFTGIFSRECVARAGKRCSDLFGETEDFQTPEQVKLVDSEDEMQETLAGRVSTALGMQNTSVRVAPWFETWYGAQSRSRRKQDSVKTEPNGQEETAPTVAHFCPLVGCRNGRGEGRAPFQSTKSLYRHIRTHPDLNVNKFKTVYRQMLSST